MDSKECYNIWSTNRCSFIYSIMGHGNHTHIFMEGIVYGTIGSTNANNKEISYTMV